MLTPIETWRLQKFGSPANAGSGADTEMPAHDGIPNLMKYALNLEPNTPSVLGITMDTTTGFLRLTVSRNPSASDLTFAIEVNGDLSKPNGWTTVGTTVEQNTPTTLRAHDNTPVSPGPRRFMRLKITKP